MIPVVSDAEISSLKLALKAEQADFSVTWSETTKTGFLMTSLKKLNVGRIQMVLAFH